MTEKQSPFACDMTAIAPEQRGAHIATIEKLFGSVQSSRELPWIGLAKSGGGTRWSEAVHNGRDRRILTRRHE
jgi:hypothetical protein